MPIKLPPGPRFSVLQTALYARDPYGYLVAMQRKYGDPFTIPALNGTLVVTGTPAYIQQIFSADPDTFLTFGAKAIEPVVGPNSLLLLSGARHRRDRKLLTPPLHGARMRAYGETIRQAALAAMDRVDRRTGDVAVGVGADHDLGVLVIVQERAGG